MVALTYQQWEDRRSVLAPVKGEDGAALDPEWRKVAFPKDKHPLEEYPLSLKRLHPDDATRRRRFVALAPLVFKYGSVFEMEEGGLPKTSRAAIEDVTAAEFDALVREEAKAKQAEERERRNAAVDAEAEKKKPAKAKASEPSSKHSISRK